MDVFNFGFGIKLGLSWFHRRTSFQVRGHRLSGENVGNEISSAEKLTAHEPVRGKNPKPRGGWNWSLTDYEVAYVREFRVRPKRDASWVENDADEARLDAEAKAINQSRSAKHKRATYNRSVLTFLSATILIASLILISVAFANFLRVMDVQDETIKIEEQLNG